VKAILLLGTCVASAFLLLYLIDSAYLVSGLGVNKPSPLSYVWTIAYAAALIGSQFLCAQLLRPRRNMPPSWFYPVSLGNRLALSFGITSVLATVIFGYWLATKL
jgi:hypothetical protein